ncbi:MAG: glutamine hydrolyzing CTP synthase [Minisyncoccia bacterium]
MNQKPCYIFISGGVFSGLGKGIASASIGKILQFRGFKVSSIKIDPYINVDAGTLRPTEHGEVFVTTDGGETDEDLGHYERFLDLNLLKDNNITTGKIYGEVIQNEREGKYLGQTVEAIPHLTNEIKRKIKNIADKAKVDFLLIEIGGTVGEYQNELYYRAARIMQNEGEKVIFCHLVYLPIPEHLGEMKTKPAQQSVEMLGRLGIQPDFIIGRAKYPLDEKRKEKLSVFCNINKENIISDPDTDLSYKLPLVFEEQHLAEKILQKLNLKPKTKNLSNNFTNWKKFISKFEHSHKIVKIGIIGKYFATGDFKLADSYISVIEAIKHASINNKVKPEIFWIDSKDFEKDKKNLKLLKNLDGIIVPGGFGKSGVEGKILAIQYARENNLPFLGLCYGLQLAVIEFARNVCQLKGANSTEIEPQTPYPVIDFLPWQKELIKENKYGATMRLGGQTVKIKKGTLAAQLYKKPEVIERFRHRYEISPEYIDILEKNGFVFSGSTPDGKIKQIGELPHHKYFIGSQFHPEFTSRPLTPNPLFNGFLKACLKK